MNSTIKLALIGVGVALGAGYLTTIIRPITAPTLGTHNDLVVGAASAALVAVVIGKVL